MSFLLMRTASVLAAGFLLAGPSCVAQASATAGGATSPVAADDVASCPAHWTADHLPVPPVPATAGAQVQSMAALSPTNVWMLAGSPYSSVGETSVYHFTGTAWEEIANLDNSDPSFSGQVTVARSDSDVWVIGEDVIIGEGNTGVEAWHYDGSTWTEHAPPLPSGAKVEAAALGSNGVLYLAGNKGYALAGIIWSYDGSQWTDLTPPNPPYEYEALAVTASGTLIAGGGLDSGTGFVGHTGTLQERSGTTWTTISLSTPVEQVSGLSVAPGGTVYAVGMRTTVQSVLIEQHPGSRSATVLDVPAAEPPGTNSGESLGVVAVGSGDVWLLGQNGYPQLRITHFDGSRFFAASTPNNSTDGYAILGGASLGSAVLAYGGIEIDGGNFGESPELLAVCPVQVTRDAIVPSQQRTSLGSQMFWSVPAGGGRRHELVAPGIFDSGPLGPGGSFLYTFFAAATYAVTDTRTGAAETVQVPPAVSPASGVTSTVYAITCASMQAPVGYAYRLLIERPWSGRYTPLTTTRQPTATFLPYHGTGTYRFECQLQTPDGVTAASPPAAVQVYG